MADLTGKSEQPAPQYIDAATPLRITTCPDCGIVFALPLAVFLERVAAGGVVSCPNGHPVILGKPKIAPGDTLALSASLVAELAQMRHELAVARGALLRATPVSPAREAAPATPEEILRRINLLVSRVRFVGRESRRLCALCGKNFQNNYSFKRHLQEQHAEKIAALPADAFN
jgi:hypothetical protein